MSDFTGPGRNNEISTIRSSHRFGCSFWSSSRWPGDSIWKQPSIRGTDQLESARVVQSDAVEVYLLARRSSDLIECVAHGREHPNAEDVELQVAEQLDVVFVGLDHPVTVRASFQRNTLDQVVRCEHDPARVQRDVSGEPVESFGHTEQELELLELQVDALELGKAVHGLAQVPRRYVRKGRRDHPDLDLGKAKRFANLTQCRTRAESVDHRNASGPLGSVPRQDHVVDVFATRGFHVDVDVGQLVAHRVQEPLERQVVPQGVDVGDAGEVTDK